MYRIVLFNQEGGEPMYLSVEEGGIWYYTFELQRCSYFMDDKIVVDQFKECVSRLKTTKIHSIFVQKLTNTDEWAMYMYDQEHLESTIDELKEL